MDCLQFHYSSDSDWCVCVHWSLFSTTVTDMTVSSGCYTDKSWLVWCWKINGMKWRTPKTAVFSLTCKADPEKKSCGFPKSTTRWTMACSISCVKSQGWKV